MLNDYYLLRRVVEEEGLVSFATALDSSTYKGEVVDVPTENPKLAIGDKVLFLKGTGEDLELKGEQFKAVKFEDLIMKI